jgi:hypothetical protein
MLPLMNESNKEVFYQNNKPVFMRLFCSYILLKRSGVPVINTFIATAFDVNP